MKIIHLADVHLGSKMESRLPNDKAAKRRNEIRASFLRTAEYAEQNGVTAIIIAGDLFDGNNPLKKDKEFFYDVVEKYGGVDFLYLRGNHDDLGGYERELKNLKTFGKEWTYYRYGQVVIAGVELCAENSLSAYSSLDLSPADYNIVTMHGEWNDGGAGGVNLLKLKNKNIDYLALGHIHTAVEKRIDERGIARYSGCLEGRGFDDCGEKGFYLLDTYGGKMRSEFVKAASRTIYKYEVDVSGATTATQVYEKVKAAITAEPKDMVRVELVGERDFDEENLADDIAEYIADKYFFVSVKDRTLRKFRIEDYYGDKSLKGEFIREVLSSGELTEEQKRKVIAYGVKALTGREVD